jgi:hypothetical protein
MAHHSVHERTDEDHPAARTHRGSRVVASSFVTAGEAAADEGEYGSGAIGPWESGSKAISTLDQIRPVLANDGLYMFGDSIAVQDGHLLAQRLLSRTGDVIAVHNWSGRPTAPAVDALAQWAGADGMPRRILCSWPTPRNVTRTCASSTRPSSSPPSRPGSPCASATASTPPSSSGKTPATN